MFEGDDDRLSAEELAAVIQNAEERLRLWRQRSILSGLAFFVSCLLVSMFLKGHSLYSYWKPFGTYLLYLSMGLLIAFLYCSLLLWGAWSALRDTRKGNAYSGRA
jgi:Na+/melibiose symporter-like transporter